MNTTDSPETGCSTIIVRYDNHESVLPLEFDDISSSQIANALQLFSKDMLYLRIDGMKDSLTGTEYNFLPTLTEETRFEGVDKLRPGATYDILIHDVREDYVAQLQPKEVAQVKAIFDLCSDEKGLLNMSHLINYYNQQCEAACNRYQEKLKTVIEKSPNQEAYHRAKCKAKREQAKEKAQSYILRYKEMDGHPITWKTFLSHSAMIILSEKRHKQQFKRVLSTTCVTPTSPAPFEFTSISTSY